MRVVHVRVSQADFRAIIEAMREWVDRYNCWLERFETEAGEGGSIVIKARFTEDDLAELFRREFEGIYGGPSTSAGRGMRFVCTLVFQMPLTADRALNVTTNAMVF